MNTRYTWLSNERRSSPTRLLHSDCARILEFWSAPSIQEDPAFGAEMDGKPIPFTFESPIGEKRHQIKSNLHVWNLYILAHNHVHPNWYANRHQKKSTFCYFASIFISISVRNLRKIHINGKNNNQLSKHKNAQSTEYMHTSPYYLFLSEREAHASGIRL